MSGVYIKDMKIPKTCDECWALDDYGDYPRCRITEEQRGYNFPIREKRMDKCPLVPVPPHGRLIDADVTREEIDRIRPGRCYEDAWALTVMDNAPTIIPAESKEET